MATDRSTLFIPPINPDDVIWMGLPVSPEDALRKWDVDEVKFTNEVNAVLAHLASQGSTTVFAIAGQVSEGVTFLGFDEKNLDVLKGVVEKCRVVKDEFEVALIAKANRVSGAAHRAVMEGAKKADNESVLEGTFIGRCIAQGAKEQSYHGIFAGGRAAATLHYDANDKPLAGKQNLLVDAGAEWQCYAADIVSSAFVYVNPASRWVGVPVEMLTKTRLARSPSRASSPPSPAQSTTSPSACRASVSACSRRASSGMTCTSAPTRSPLRGCLPSESSRAIRRRS